MNRRKDWQNALALANENLKKVGKEIKITDFYHDGNYTCEIYENGVSKMVFAENYYEDELEDLIEDALDYALKEGEKQKISPKEEEKQKNKLHIVIAECMGTDGEFSSEVYPCKTEKEAFDMCCNLIADMAETMSVQDIDPENDWAIGDESGNWWYRVRVEEHDSPYFL